MKETKLPRMQPNKQQPLCWISFAALAVAVFGLIFPMFSVLAILLSLIALWQIKRENMRGAGWAFLALFGSIALILSIICIMFMQSQG